MNRASRCTPRKHVIERGQTLCDCGVIMAGLTAGKNAYVVTILDYVQAHALAKIAGASDLGTRSPEAASDV